ncbi:hypothetical protein GCM10023323_39570 [Streptomyces thinghirensis]|uniref:FAD-binding oxidoreductase/transferase type 4 C-terminal domain-containing protein n=2 Tax=Streptomyces thinghirensis TaxID=551547 RepID=A0ABP9T7R2_9ACTN
MVEARLRLTGQAIKQFPGARLTTTRYDAQDGQHLHAAEIDEKDRTVQVGHPSLAAYDVVQFRGRNGGHLDFSPIVPARGQDVYDFYLEAKALSAERGFDFFVGFHNYPRRLAHINLIAFDRDDEAQCKNARDLFEAIVAAAKRHGYSGYRPHVDYMELVGEQYDWNDHALRRFTSRIKTLLDPGGIISPGKHGIWSASGVQGD